MVLHLIRITAIILVILLFSFLPFFPGSYDGLAITLSMMAHLLGIVSQLLIPVGIVWLIVQLSRRQQGYENKQNYRFAVISIVILSFVLAIDSLPSFFNTGYSFGLIVVSIWVFVVYKIWQQIKSLKQSDGTTFNPAPLYMIIVPIVVLSVQITLSDTVVEFSRNRAIENSVQLINGVENYHQTNGHYPVSITGLWNDYRPEVIGIEHYNYEPNGNAYNIFFVQYRFYPLGTQEVTMYNKDDRQVMRSHDSWILTLPQSQLLSAMGHYAVHDASQAHWKYFLFD